MGVLIVLILAWAGVPKVVRLRLAQMLNVIMILSIISGLEP
jgi:hypothetical protein